MYFYEIINLLTWNVPHFLIVSFILTILGYILLHIVFHKKKPLVQYFWFFCSSFYLQLLYMTTIGQRPGSNFIRHKPNFIPFIEILQVYSMGFQRMMLQIAINLLLLAPLGFLLPVQLRKFRSFPRTVLTVLAVSLLIETLQYFIGRSADIDDVIMNTVGGMLGYLCFMVYEKIMKWIQSIRLCRKNSG